MKELTTTYVSQIDKIQADINKAKNPKLSKDLDSLITPVKQKSITVENLDSKQKMYQPVSSET